MQKIDMQWLPPNKNHISQIYSNGVEFAFATKTKQCTDFIFCKDFLHDCVYAILYQKPVKVYGFSYDPKDNPIGLKKVYLLVNNNLDKDFDQKMTPCLDFLHQIEKKMRLFRTKIYECNDPPKEKNKVFLFRGSKIWLNSPPLLSLYSLFIRIGLCHTVGVDFMTTIDKMQTGEIKATNHNDARYLASSRKAIDAILSHGYRKFFFKENVKNYPESVDISTFHNYFGIVNFTQLLTSTNAVHAKFVPEYWHRKLARKLVSGE
jgi:hypothetical protein